MFVFKSTYTRDMRWQMRYSAAKLSPSKSGVKTIFSSSLNLAAFCNTSSVKCDISHHLK